MKDRISRGLQHCHEMCCKKGGCRGRRACMVQRWFHHGNVVSGQVDLYITLGQYLGSRKVLKIFVINNNIDKIGWTF